MHEHERQGRGAVTKRSRQDGDDVPQVLGEPLPERMPDTQPPSEVMFFKPLEGNWYTVWRN
jgi:hypothetical protein